MPYSHGTWYGIPVGLIVISKTRKKKATCSADPSEPKVPTQVCFLKA